MSTENMRIFSERLAQARKRLYPRQLDLGNILKISGSTVGNWEAGKNFPDTETLPELQKALNVSLDWLFGLDESPNIRPGSVTVDIPKSLRDAAEQIVSAEGYADLPDLIRSLLREKTGVGRINSVSPKVRTAALQLVELAAQTISDKPEVEPLDGLEPPPAQRAR